MMFREKFIKDPTSRGLNYEKIYSQDPSLRSVRVNGSYRAIVKVPGKDTKNVYTLLWIDSHDEAYAWAEKKRFSFNPSTNAVEIYTVIEKDELQTNQGYTEAKLFQSVSDNELNSLGISSEHF